MSIDLDYRLGYGMGYDIGYAHGVRDEGAAWSSILTGCTDTWRSPRHNEVVKLREPDYQPCSRRCDRCSRCIASRAFWSRGGRRFLGVDAEAALVRQAS